MADTFQKVADKYRSSPVAVLLFIAAFAMLAIGLNNFAEDTYSSYLGLVDIEEKFNLKVQIFAWTYWLMSVAPQIASIVFFFMYLSTGEKKYLYISLVSQTLDFGADIWYRSNSQLLDNFEVAIVSGILTFLYFTFGSEFFTTVGFGLVLKLWGPAVREFKKAYADVSNAYSGNSAGGGKGGGGGENRNGNGYRPQEQKQGEHRISREEKIAMLQQKYHPSGNGKNSNTQPQNRQ